MGKLGNTPKFQVLPEVSQGENKIFFIGVVKEKAKPSPNHCYSKEQSSWLFTKQDVFKEGSQGEGKINFKHRRSLNEKL